MTATDVHTDIDHASDGEVEATGDELYELVASNDHKSVGRLWIGMGLLFLLGLAVLAVLTGFERIDLDGIALFGSDAGYQQAWTLVRTGGVFLVAIPLMIGLGTAIVPLQVGSPSIAFPRLAAASFWTWLVGAGIHIASFIADGGLGPAGGTREASTLLTVTSLGVMVLAVVAASICIVTTVIALRPTGMTLQRVPVFTWSMLVACSVWLLSLPVLGANLIYAWADLQGREPIFFGNPDRLWSDVEWAFLQPQIFVLAIPALGFFADVVPVAAKTRQANRPVILVLIGLLGAVSFGAWAQHAFSKGANPLWPTGNFIYEEPLYAVVTLLALLAVLGVLGGVADTVRRGSRPTLSPGLLGGMLAANLLLFGTLVGLVRVFSYLPIIREWVDYEAAGTENDAGVPIMYASAGAVFWLVMAAVIAAAIGALAWWAPKIFGGYANPALANLGLLAVFGGGLIAGLMNLITGFMEQPDISLDPTVDGSVGSLNAIAMVGVALIGIGALAAIGSFLAAARSDEVLPDDPWEGHTLEWAAPSPPPTGNFVEPIDLVRSEAPLLDEFEEVN